MPQFIVSQPPTDTETGMSRWLNELQNKMNIALGRTGSYPPIYNMPNKPQNGNIYYFGEQILPDILWAGFWGYSEGEWTYLGGDQAVQSAYGGITTNGVVAIPDLTATWYTIVEFTQSGVVPPKGVIQDTVNSELVLPYKGVYSFNSALDVGHNEVNSGRVIEARLINNSSGTTSSTVYVGTGRNASATNVIVPGVMIQITDNALENDISLQLRSPDGYGSVQIQGGFNVNMVSEIQV